MNIDVKTLDTASIASYTAAAAKSGGVVEFLLNMIPASVVDAMAKNEILQIVVFAVFFGTAMAALECAIRTSDWNAVAEAYVLLEVVK